jgi:demethylmenaquinone methyltransferase/2-methoxy-6-polyprenyl-1,4-benzoquinol methylase
MVLLLADSVGTSGSVTGVDFCEEMIAIASDKARRWNRRHVGRVAFFCGDAKQLDFPDGTFDVVSVAFGMRNITDTARALREVQRILKPHGRFVCLELTRPEPPWFLALYRFYLFRVIPFVARIVTKLDGPYRYLPKSIYGFYSVAEFKQVIEACGFSQVRVHPMTWGVATAYEARR